MRTLEELDEHATKTDEVLGLVVEYLKNNQENIGLITQNIVNLGTITKNHTDSLGYIIEIFESKDKVGAPKKPIRWRWW